MLDRQRERDDAGRMKRLLPLFLLGASPLPTVDLLIRGGSVHAGGAAPFTGDVAVRAIASLRVGALADIVVFDPLRYAARATYGGPGAAARTDAGELRYPR